MADFFKGLAGGFGTGLQFGQAMQARQERERQMQMRDDLAQEANKYGVTEGAYGPGLQENIQQLQGLREKDPAQAAAYDQAIGELTRRQGLTAADYSVASGPTDYATRQEARQAAAPLRAEGLAGVYRQYGDVTKADELEARAFDQQRAIAREARDVKAFDTAQAAAAQQGLLTGAQLTDIQRKQNLQAALDLRLADINTQTFEKPEMRTQAVLSLVEELQGPQAAAQLRASYSQNELNDISLQAKKFDEGFRQSRAKGVIPALEWFDEQNTSFKLERDPKNPFRVIQVNTDNTRSVFADAKNERELGMIIDAKAKPGGFLELAKFDLDQKKADAAIEASRSTVGLNNARAGQIKQMNEALATNLKNSEEAKAIQTQFAMLDDDNDPGGAKRQSLITQFNMLSVKAGGTIPTTGGGKKGSVLQTPVDLKKNDDGTYTAFSKDGGRALYNTFNGEEIPLGMEVDTYRGMKANAQKNGVGLVTGEENGRLVLKFVGPDGKFYDDAEKAKYAKPAKSDAKPAKSDAKPGGLDTSRTPVVQPAAEPTAPTPKPEKRSGETQTEFRARLLAWDRNRIAYERLMTEQRLRGQLSGNAAGLRRPLVD